MNTPNSLATSQDESAQTPFTTRTIDASALLAQYGCGETPFPAPTMRSTSATSCSTTS